jgi:DNA topoisomerase II
MGKENTNTKTEKSNDTKLTGEDAKIAKMYQKKTHYEHIWDRPDTYVGSISLTKDVFWVFNKTKQIMEKREIEFIPALYKIFDEIIVNAYDQYIKKLSEYKKTRSKKIKLVTAIRVDIDKEKGLVSVYNNGDGIDVAMHPKYKAYVPEFIFGALLSSTNYDDDEERITGGKNGYGAKLTNIFSKKFKIETVDHIRKLKFYQKYTNNMLEKSDPEITEFEDTPFTRITFKPDFEKFGVTGFTDDMVAMMERRVYDMAGLTNASVKVYLNNEKVKIADFETYVNIFLTPEERAKSEHVYEKLHDRWEIVAMPSSNEFEQVSFVNGIYTGKGGKHVSYIMRMIGDGLKTYIKKTKKIDVDQNHINNNVMIFVKSTIVNPNFTSQIKDCLETNVSSFGSRCSIDEAFVKRLAKTGIVERIIEFYEFKQKRLLEKTDGKMQKNLYGIPKLEDANFAGVTKGNKNQECALILTEGDSAATLARSGLTVVGRDYYGIFPLKGKVLNVRELKDSIAGRDKIAENDEIENLRKILGLQTGKEYTDTSDLRYGKIIIMTDQDFDGSHIKGLLMNMFDSLFPSLLKIDGYLTSLLTPVVKITKGNTTRSFYNQNKFEKWRDSHNGGKGWNVKYYKGLGTSTSDEGKEYFTGIKEKLIVYEHCDTSNESIDMAFNKKRPDDRKTWLSKLDRNDALDQDQKRVTHTEFINKDMIFFSNYDVERSIPNLVDGLKTSQRKILYACFKRKLTKEIKVAQLSGYISEHSNYHHGEVSLHSTIIAMAQNFVGSNNINTLVPQGGFGSRAQGGDDAASPRYIKTYLQKLTGNLFIEDDKTVLISTSDDDGKPCEPEYYVPIIPFILVNGSIGIGTGYSCTIPSYNPLDLIHYVRNKINDKPTETPYPWYRGFKGTVVKIGKDRYITKGKYKRTGAATIEITELPIGMWTKKYEEILDTFITKPKEKKKQNAKKTASKKITTKELILKDRKNGNVKDENDISIHLTFKNPMTLVNLLKKKEKDGVNGFEKLFKLTTNVATSNMNLFNKDCVIKSYASVDDIIDEYYDVRMDFYNRRKIALLKIIKDDLEERRNKVRFVKAVNSDDIIIKGKTLDEVNEQLETAEPPFTKMRPRKKVQQTEIMDDDDNDGKKKKKEDDVNYKYLTNMSISSLSKTLVLRLENEMIEKQQEYTKLDETPLKTLWLDELKIFEKNYCSFAGIKTAKPKKTEQNIKNKSDEKTEKKQKQSSDKKFKIIKKKSKDGDVVI